MRILLGLLLAASISAPALAACPPLLDHTLPSLTDQATPLCQFEGKVLLIVNTASQCGYTPQYEGLEALYRKYRSRGLVILGFPSNDFGGQEPGSNKEIASFCVNRYAVDFPMFGKSSVRGAAANPLFAELAKTTGKAPQWNFHKYLVDRGGRQVLSFETRVEPTDPRLVSSIEKFLAGR